MPGICGRKGIEECLNKNRRHQLAEVLQEIKLEVTARKLASEGPELS